MATIMSSTPVRYPTPNASTGSPQHTSVEVTDPLLCPPGLDCVCLECPTLVSGSGGIGASVPYLAQSLSCGIQYTFYNIGYT